MRGRFLVLCLIAACRDDGSPITSPNPEGLDGIRVTWAHEATDGPIDPRPACQQLEAFDGECCLLSCHDPGGFAAACGVPGLCVTYFCPLEDGGLMRPTVCLPPEPPPSPTHP